MNTQDTIESVIYYLDVDSIKSLSLTNKTINEVAKKYINTYLCLTKNKKQDVDLSTMKWYTQHYEINVDKISSIEVLEWWFNTCKYIIFTNIDVDLASNNGYLPVLKWWFNTCEKNNIEFKYTDSAVNLAFLNGHLLVIKWWFNTCTHNNMKFKYTNNSVDWAFRNGHLSVLDWWFYTCNENYIKFKYTKNAIDLAS